MIFIDRDTCKNYCGIYQIRNTINNRVYIGQTKQPFEKRYLHHCWKLKSGSHDNQWLQNAFNKYGTDNFVFEILLITPPEAELINKYEYEMISNAKKKGICYNLIDGGGGRGGIPMPEETKRRLGELNRFLNTGKKASDETKRKMSEIRRGKKRKPEDIQKAVNTRQLHISEGLSNKTTKLTAEQAKQIKIMLMNGIPYDEIVSCFPVSKSNINAIRSNRSWKFVYVDGWNDYLRNTKRTKKYCMPTLCQAQQS